MANWRIDGLATWRLGDRGPSVASGRFCDLALTVLRWRMRRRACCCDGASLRRRMRGGVCGLVGFRPCLTPWRIEHVGRRRAGFAHGGLWSVRLRRVWDLCRSDSGKSWLLPHWSGLSLSRTSDRGESYLGESWTSDLGEADLGESWRDEGRDLAHAGPAHRWADQAKLCWQAAMILLITLWHST